MTEIADWRGYPTDQEMDAYFWVPDEWGQAVVVEWRAREEHWLTVKHTQHTGETVEHVLPAEAARRWAYVLPCLPPREVAP